MASSNTPPVVLTVRDTELAREATRAIEARTPSATGRDMHLTLDGDAPISLELPGGAAELITALLKSMAEGKSVLLVPQEEEITTQKAADLLNVSRPYLVGLIDKGELPARMVGTQRRLPLEIVLEYKARSKATRSMALQEMADLDQGQALR